MKSAAFLLNSSGQARDSVAKAYDTSLPDPLVARAVVHLEDFLSQWAHLPDSVRKEVTMMVYARHLKHEENFDSGTLDDAQEKLLLHIDDLDLD